MIGLAISVWLGSSRDSYGHRRFMALLLFHGGVFSLANVIQAVKITDWLGGSSFGCAADEFQYVLVNRR